MKIEAYQFTPEHVDTGASQLLPFKKLPDDFCAVLDAVTAACEQGKLTQNGWLSQCFADKEVFDEFLEAFEDFAQVQRIHDRWYDAIRRICNVADEENFITASEMTAILHDAALDSE